MKREGGTDETGNGTRAGQGIEADGCSPVHHIEKSGPVQRLPVLSVNV